jgi:hypothetical protein
MQLRNNIFTYLLAEHYRIRALRGGWTPGEDRHACAAITVAKQDERVIGVPWNTGRMLGYAPTGAETKAVTRELVAMEVAGLVTRYAPGGRLTHVKLTPAGEAAATELKAAGGVMLA